MADAKTDLRAAYLRLADPVGTPANVVYLVSAVGCIGAYGLLQPRGMVPRIVPWTLAVGVAYYLYLRWRALRRVKDATEESLRWEYTEKARKVLAAAPSFPMRSLLWLGLGGWGWVSVVRGRDYPLGGDGALAVFLGAMGFVLGVRYLHEWRVQIPALRRDLEALGIAPHD
jgi:hypothetical protein